MKYKIIVDKQSRLNPSTEKREYEIDIEELRAKGDIYDSLIITSEGDYVLRRLSLSEFHVLSVLEEPVKEPLKDINIELFEGDNYIYLVDMVGNKFYAEYLIKNDFNDLYVVHSEMNSAINQSAKTIEIGVNQKLQNYSTTEEMNSAIEMKAGEINIEVGKKVNNEDFTSANITLKLNDGTSTAKIKADKIDINGTVSANGNFKVDTNGNMECNNGKFNGGNIVLNGGTNEKDAKFIIQDSNSNMRTYITPRSIYLGGGGANDEHFDFGSGVLNIGKNNGSHLQLTQREDGTRGKFYMSVTDAYVAQGSMHALEYHYDSLAEKKKNIKLYEKNAIDIIKDTDVYEFNYKSQKDNYKKNIGFVIGDNYRTSKEIFTNDKVGINSYSVLGVLWKAIKEQQEQIELLQKEIRVLKGEQ